MTYDEMIEYLDIAGYNVADMVGEEVDTLAEAEGYVYNHELCKYEEAN